MSTVVAQHQLLSEIFSTTEKIRKKFPELYLLLSETPLFLNSKNRDLHLDDFEQYLESLKMQLYEFENLNQVN